jgi:hypothetical protein
VVQTVTSSIVYSSGSNIFGCDLNSRQTFTGSLNVTGSTTLNGALTGTSATFSSTVCSPTLVTNTISLGGNAVCPTNAGLGYGMFGYSGIGLGIASSANGPNQGIGFFVCGDVERMRIITSGNVGIGTLCPSYLLDVNGTGRFACSVTATTLALGSVTPCTNGIYFNNAVANGANYGYIRTNCLTVNTTQLILGSTYGYNTPVDALTIYNGAATLSGLLTVNGFGTSYICSGGTGYNKLTIRNTTAGVANGAQLSVGVDTDADQLYIQSFSSTFTTSGMNIAAGAVINGEGPGGLSIAATQSNIGFYTNGAGAANLRMTIACAGKVTVGNPAANGTTTDLSITGDKVNANGYYSRLIFQNSNQSGGSSASIRGERMTSNFATELTFYTNVGSVEGEGTERMRITCGGDILMGAGNVGNLLIRQTVAGTVDNNSQSLGNNGINYMNRVSGVGLYHIFFNNGNNIVGSITSCTTATQFNTTSDYRLKMDLKNYNGICLINQIKTYDFAWKINDARTYGVIAHELSDIIPYAVTGEKDAIDERGCILPQAVDYSKIVTPLIKAVQEQQCTICSQATMINTLKTCLGIS